MDIFGNKLLTYLLFQNFSLTWMDELTVLKECLVMGVWINGRDNNCGYGRQHNLVFKIEWGLLLLESSGGILLYSFYI